MNPEKSDFKNSYFRRADGAILLYDCTCERSFLNVRNWIQTIQQYSQKDIPLLICASKVDLRDGKNGAKFVQKEEGERLAKSVGAMFLETSSKSNVNVHTVAYELTRKQHNVMEKKLATFSNG
uniref:Uncharacterized protein n=1 Tax=Romanomermis culicivorax TaxID=13658 RepID=A0A915KL40_ROMCU